MRRGKRRGKSEWIWLVMAVILISYVYAVDENNLRVYYNFENNLSNQVNNTWTLQNIGATFETVVINHSFGYHSLYCNGADNVYNHSLIDLFDFEEHTITFVMRPAAVQHAETFGIGNLYGNDGYYCWAEANNNPNIECILYDGGFVAQIPNNRPFLTVGQWGRLTIITNTTGTYFYENTTLIEAGLVTSHAEWANSFDDWITEIAFCNNPSVGANPFNGYIDEFKLYNDSIEQSQLDRLVTYNTLGLDERLQMNVTILQPQHNVIMNYVDVRNNHSTIWINGTHNSTNITQCLINDSRFSTDYGENRGLEIYNFSFVNTTALGYGQFHLQVDCNNSYTYTGSDTLAFQINFTYGVDNCTVFNATSFYFSVYNELSNELLISNVSILLQYYYLSDPSNQLIYTIDMQNNDTYRLCQLETGIFYYGDMSIIMSAEGYQTRTFYRYTINYSGNFSGYLLPKSENVNLITFNVVNTASSPIENATFRIYRLVGTSQVIIYEGLTDFGGQIGVYLDQSHPYDFYVEAEGYPTKSFTLQPISYTYYLTLTATGEDIYTPTYQGVRYKIQYDGFDNMPPVINRTSAWHNISFIVEGADIELIGINLSYHSYDCLPASCYNTRASQGMVSVLINTSSTGGFNTAFFFRRTGGSNIYVNDDYIKVVPFMQKVAHTLIDLFQEIRADTSPNFISVMVIVLDIIAIGIGASLGLGGILLIFPVMAVTILCSTLGLIHSSIGWIVGIAGTLVYLANQMRGG